MAHVNDTNVEVVDRNLILKRSSAINSTAIAARHTVINFGRQYGEFVPKYEEAWNPEPMPERLNLFKRIFRSIGA